MNTLLKPPVRKRQQIKHSSSKPYQKAGSFRIQPYRRWVQAGFLAVTLWIGIEFIIFVHQLETGQIPTISRPPGVEAFLPISALISLKYWLMTGVFNTIHPSALVLLLIIVATALFLKKGFCSWVCPIGLLSEGLTWIHQRLFDRQFSLPRWLDYPLRSLKYLLMFFFVYAVFVQMGVVDLQRFIYSPYNKVADIKMLKFFSEMSATTFWVLLILVGLSLLIPYFWCRYLCPYGALLGMLSWLSPFKIHRNKSTCIDCSKCTLVCPAKINVHKAKAVFSDECHACLKCVDVCPVKDTLYFSATTQKVKIPRKVYALIIVLLFLLGTTLARLSGYWQNSITLQEYQYHIQKLDDPLYQHNRGQVPQYEDRRIRGEKELNPESF
ncbi:MAG: 4Fe-4S binding protein [Calditrichia bacterium]